jgi:hypothetical protein
MLLLSLVILTVATIITSPLELYGSQSDIGFYTLNSYPGGPSSLEPLLAKWWNFRFSQSPSTAENWPACLKGDGGILGNNSIVFLGDPAAAGEGNVNARNQKCEISSNQLLYLVIYAGECSSGEPPRPKTAESQLLCAQRSNEGLKSEVKVDGNDISQSNIINQNSTQQFTLTIPPVNAFGLREEVGNHTSMTQVYYLLFKPMPIGDHTIDLKVTRIPPPPSPVENLRAIWDVKVVP